MSDTLCPHRYMSKGTLRAAVAASAVVCKGVDLVLGNHRSRTLRRAAAAAAADAMDVEGGAAASAAATRASALVASEATQGEVSVEGGAAEGATSATSAMGDAPLHAFCVVRPPGHHAGRDGKTRGCQSLGFCLLNNVCLGAAHARPSAPISRTPTFRFSDFVF